MLKKCYYLLSTLCLFGCSLSTGMQDLDTSAMPVMPSKKQLIHASIIPITYDLLKKQPISQYEYRLAPGDSLSIEIWQHPEFNARNGSRNTDYLVNNHGEIVFPLLGPLTVSGKNTEQIRIQLTHQLKTYIPEPHVLVRISHYRGKKVYVYGEVLKPGSLTLDDQPLTIADALIASGGINQNTSDPRFIYVLRGTYAAPDIFWLNAERPNQLWLAQHFKLEKDDILYVSGSKWVNFKRRLSHF